MQTSQSLQAAVWICLLLSVAGNGQTPGSQKPAPKDAQEKEGVVGRMKRSAAEYKLVLGSHRATSLSLRPEPVISWMNQVRDSGGAIFIWTAKGRPEAIATFFTWRDGQIKHEFQSLSRSPLAAEYNGQPLWHPTRAGVELRPVPDAPEPAESGTQRLSQMKSLARRFSSTFLGWVENDPNRDELRLLTQPLLRYDSEDPDLLDGALFAFVQGTDPETLLLLEGRRAGTRFEWQYGLAPMTAGALETRYRDKSVWTSPAWDSKVDPNRPYIQFVSPDAR